MTQQPERVSKFNRRQLEQFLSQPDCDMTDMVQGIIDKDNLPYEILIVDGLPTLRDTLSPGELHLEKFITVDDETIAMKSRAIRAANTPYEVLICGATGTGKEIIARSMIGSRSGAFKAINCAGIPEQLMESLLFGHLKGSFTGAYSDKSGLIQEANGGVMFLDEVGELPVLLQAKLLRVLQEKVVMPVGANKTFDITCKFVFATNRNLLKMIEAGTFREDLYARISKLELAIKPLKERVKDAVPICKSMKDSGEFLKKYESELNQGLLDLSLNVRSLERYIARYNTWGGL